MACACAGFAEVHLPLLHGTLWVGCAYLRVEGSHGKESPWQHPGLCRLSFLLCLGESSSITVSPLLTPRKVLLKQPATAHHCCHLPLDLQRFRSVLCESWGSEQLVDDQLVVLWGAVTSWRPRVWAESHKFVLLGSRDRTDTVRGPRGWSTHVPIQWPRLQRQRLDEKYRGAHLLLHYLGPLMPFIKLKLPPHFNEQPGYL